MNDSHVAKIAQELNLPENQIKAVAGLLESGATVPFIARYRKESTGSLDETVIMHVRDRMMQLADLDARKEAVIKSLEQHGHLTDELNGQVLNAPTMAILEDIYLPYKPKRRTRGMAAREKGLEPLALAILSQSGIVPHESAREYIDPEKGVTSIDDALSGARDIIAETINEDGEIRAALRRLFAEKALIECRLATGKEDEGAKFKDYFEWKEPAATVPSHRLLAMRRGEKEDILNLTIAPSEEEAVNLIENITVTGEGPDSEQVKQSANDAYKRLLSRSMETEIRMAAKNKADEEAIRVFAENLRELLLASPLGAKRVMGIDPGFRTGCKVVCLDRQGKLLHHETIHPHIGEKGARQAESAVKTLCEKYGIEAVAVGNGTAGRETEAFIRSIDLPDSIVIIMVNESGASIYSASETAREEFPDLDLTVRGAVSIGRRLMDPLAELVKIDPKSIGVGQYQHDVDQLEFQNDRTGSINDPVVIFPGFAVTFGRLSMSPEQDVFIFKLWQILMVDGNQSLLLQPVHLLFVVHDLSHTIHFFTLIEKLFRLLYRFDNPKAKPRSVIYFRLEPELAFSGHIV
ncbi:MAG: Tex-like N-terminal domain-containing protein [Desulfobacterales bacterium]